MISSYSCAIRDHRLGPLPHQVGLNDIFCYLSDSYGIYKIDVNKILFSLNHRVWI
jgi:hypothetical protein